MTLGDFGTATAVLSNQPLEDDVRIPKMNGWDIINRYSIHCKQNRRCSSQSLTQSHQQIYPIYTSRSLQKKKLPKVGPKSVGSSPFWMEKSNRWFNVIRWRMQTQKTQESWWPAISFIVMRSGDVRIKTFAEHSMIIMGISFHHKTLNGPNRSFFNAAGKFTNQDARSGNFALSQISTG